MNLAIVLTAVRNGAKCCNHVAVERLVKDNNGKLCAAEVKDMVSQSSLHLDTIDLFKSFFLLRQPGSNSL
jgi:glycerol-3-phosphate dehydrogenase